MSSCLAISALQEREVAVPDFVDGLPLLMVGLNDLEVFPSLNDSVINSRLGQVSLAKYRVFPPKAQACDCSPDQTVCTSLEKHLPQSMLKAYQAMLILGSR